MLGEVLHRQPGDNGTKGDLDIRVSFRHIVVKVVTRREQEVLLTKERKGEEVTLNSISLWVSPYMEIRTPFELSPKVRAILSDILSYKEAYLSSIDSVFINEEYIEDIITNLFYTLLEEKITFTTTSLILPIFSNPFIIGFILLSINSNTYILIKERYTQNLLAKLIYTIKLFFIGYLALREKSYNKVLLLRSSLSAFNLEKLFKDIFPNILTNTSRNYLEEILNYKRFLKRLNSNSITTYNPIRDINPSTFSIDEIIIDISILKTFFISILDDLERTLFKDLLFFSNTIEEDSPIILEIPNIKDINRSRDINITILSTPKLTSLETTILERLFTANSSLNTLLIKDLNKMNNQSNFNPKALKECLSI